MFHVHHSLYCLYLCMYCHDLIGLQLQINKYYINPSPADGGGEGFVAAKVDSVSNTLLI